MDLKLGEMESRFADIIWERAPLGSGELVRLCEERLAWKKSTTYTMLKRLCERGLFKNEGGRVSALMAKDEFYAAQGRRLVAGGFGGSLPRFVAAFADKERLSQGDIAELRDFIERYKENGNG